MKSHNFKALIAALTLSCFVQQPMFSAGEAVLQGVYQTTCTPESPDSYFAEWKDEHGVQTMVIGGSGGDGTVSELMTLIPDLRGDQLGTISFEYHANDYEPVLRLEVYDPDAKPALKFVSIETNQMDRTPSSNGYTKASFVFKGSAFQCIRRAAIVWRGLFHHPSQCYIRKFEISSHPSTKTILKFKKYCFYEDELLRLPRL